MSLSELVGFVGVEVALGCYCSTWSCKLFLLAKILLGGCKGTAFQGRGLVSVGTGLKRLLEIACPQLINFLYYHE